MVECFRELMAFVFSIAMIAIIFLAFAVAIYGQGGPEAIPQWIITSIQITFIIGFLGAYTGNFDK